MNKEIDATSKKQRVHYYSMKRGDDDVLLPYSSSKSGQTSMRLLSGVFQWDAK
jgi:hypothetical protein